jgi:peptidyl-prolyl cis-trans isomerase A (cyclophilin A)
MIFASYGAHVNLLSASLAVKNGLQLTHFQTIPQEVVMIRRISLLILSAVCLLAISPVLSFAASKAAPAANPQVVMETSLGTIRLELFTTEAPVSVKNFLDYAAANYYDGTVFHRVIPGFMIQGGGFTADLVQKQTKASIKNEATNGLKNMRGTIAMARTQIVDSATSQFFINVVDNGALDHRDQSIPGFGYAVFGKVVAGMEVADAIAGVKTGIQKGFRDVPLTPVVIKSVRLVK